MKFQISVPLLGALYAAAFMAAPAYANVTNVAWYRLGEKDSGAASGLTGNSTTIEIVNGRNLRRFGTARYTNEIASSAVDLGSSLAMQFNGASFYSNAVPVSAAQNNFGIEAWARTPTTVEGVYCIAHNGNAANNGWGLFVSVTNNPFLGLVVSYGGQFGGSIKIGSGRPHIAAAWTHVALVRNNGTTTFYLNGTPSGTSSTTPIAPTSNFSIGGLPLFPGLVDEVRVFTFAPGQFSASDLLLNQNRAATQDATDLSVNSATLRGITDLMGLPALAWFEWGTTTNLGNTTTPQALDNSFATASFSQVVTGLTANVSYFFRAVVSNAFDVMFGDLHSFNTSPSLDTLPASDVASTVATLNGIANPKGLSLTSWFEWGVTANYGNSTPPRSLGSGGNITNFSEVLSNLFPLGTFHYRAVGSNNIGLLTGTNQTFQTAAPTGNVILFGAVNVSIQPTGAVAQGASWMLDDGPFMPSDFAQPSVTPGHHTIRFNNLLNWLEPTPVDVYVVGGRTAQVSVAFSPLPLFDFHDVPEQHARLGEPVEFLVSGMPQGSQLQVTGNPPPAGSLTFDPVTGHLTYVPSAADRLPFTLTFSSNGIPIATTTITPLQDLPPEKEVISYDRPLPDEESSDYIAISETLSPNAELFNNVSNQLFTVDISGKTLVFAAAHPAHLLSIYGGRENIKEFRIYADRVIIRDPLLLPQTHVTIHARELRFEGAGVLDTTPKSLWTKPRAVEWLDDNFAGFPGNTGHNGGDADVFVESFYADPTPAVRFNLLGGNGGPPGEGRNGIFEGGTNPAFFPGVPDPNDPNYTAITNWIRLMARAGNSTNCGVANNTLVLYSETRHNGVLDPNSVCGNSNTVAKGEAAVPSGPPGAGGRGGTLRSTLDLSAFVSQSGGAAAAPGSNYIGGTLVYQYVYRSTNIRIVNGQTFVDTSVTQAPKVAGANATAPTNTNGAPGSVIVVPDPASWLHSFGLRAVVKFAKDAYLNGRTTEARALMSDYRDILLVLQPDPGSVTNLSEAEFAETTGLDQLSQEMGAIVDRIDHNLDFFGNPAGWVPMLSFEANLTAFQNEINQSIPILYLAYWLNYAATNLQNSAAASQSALQTLRDELTHLVESYNQVQTSIPGMKIEAANIQDRIAGLHLRLQALEDELEARAQQNVEERHKLPFWKKGLGLLAVAADLVPIGQPTVGRIGEGLKLLTKIDPDHPVSSALKITNAFNVFSNKDISICFSGSITNRGTNGPGTNAVVRAARKSQLKQLTTCGKFLKDEFKEIAGVFKEVKVDKKELQAEIDKLKASDPVFKETSAELELLNKDKERLDNELAATLQAIAILASDMTENVLATDDMEVRVAQQLTALDHNALVHIKEMERRAKDRLLKFQYFTAQAFQYRLLQPFNGNLQLNTLFDRFQVIVAGPNAHVLSPDEFNNLKQLFQEDLANTIDVAMSALNANAPQHAQPRTFDLTAQELQTLNTSNQLTIDLAKHALFPSFHEDIRIVNLRITRVDAHPVGGPIGQDAVLFVDFNHLGESRLERSGHDYLFRHYQTENVSPIAWNAVVDLVHHTTNNSVLSSSSESLLRVLLRQPTESNMLLFSRPAANAEFLVRREALTDNGIDLAIDRLTLEVEYEFGQQSLSQRTLDVLVDDDLQPIIVLSLADVSGRRDGAGSFSRVFPANVSLTLQAPAAYGARPFDHWIINNVSRPVGSNSVTFTLTIGTTAEAVYGGIPSAGDAPAITQQPQNVNATVGSAASFSVTATGTSPLSYRWRKGASPLSDGGGISGATAATLLITNIGPNDAAAYSVIVSNAFGSTSSTAAFLTVTGPALVPAPAGPGNVGFVFSTVVGLNYVIEQKTNLTNPQWTVLETRSGNGSIMQFTRPANAGTSFFRLRVVNGP